MLPSPAPALPTSPLPCAASGCIPPSFGLLRSPQSRLLLGEPPPLPTHPTPSPGVEGRSCLCLPQALPRPSLCHPAPSPGTAGMRRSPRCRCPGEGSRRTLTWRRDSPAATSLGTRTRSPPGPALRGERRGEARRS